MHYACFACIIIDSVMRIDKKPSAALFRGMQTWNKKIQMSKFTNTELKSDSDSELDSDLDSKKVGAKFDTILMTKLESDFDSE